MQEKLEAIADRIGSLFTAEARHLRNERLGLKLLLIVGGGAAAGAAQFIDPSAGGGADWSKILGFGGVILLAIGGFWGAFREKTTAEALDEARKAVDEARQAQAAEFETRIYLSDLADKLRRMAHLHTASLSMREAIEQCVMLPSKNETDAARLVLQAAATSVRAAIDFQMDEAWTVSVYQAQVQPNGATELVCIASDRFDGQPAAQTRRWPVGVGHTGSTFAKADETVVPDLSALELGTLDRLPAAISHETDGQRYRSIAAVPVRVINDAMPWGVVVATSDRASRFTLHHDEKGSLSAEVARALAGMVGLAVATQR